MSYYIIPKINNWVNINPKHGEGHILSPYISSSLFQYYKDLNEQIKNNIKTNTELMLEYDEVIKIVNPYEYIFSKVPGSKFSVSKLKPKTNIFYDFLEVSTILNVFELYKNKPIKTLHLSRNNNDSIECFEMLRENYSDEIVCHDEINDNVIASIGENKFDFLFFEANIKNYDSYIISLIQCVMIILRNQLFNGSSIIKIDNIFHKPVVDILYILSSLYEKVYVLKPNTSNITTFDKYIVCKNFQYNESKARFLKLNYYRLLIFLKKLENNHIDSVLDFDIPYYFTMKLEDINIIIGQQQIDSLDLIINILKNKNRDEKIETIKKSNIQKSVSWCEKYKIPFNKFSEKTNIFLPILKEYKMNIRNEENELIDNELIDNEENELIDNEENELIDNEENELIDNEENELIVNELIENELIDNELIENEK